MRTGAAQAVALGRLGVRPVDGLQAGLLAAAERDPGAELPPEHDGLGVVVAVDVGDEEPAHVLEPAAELGEGRFEHIAGLREGPPRVDERPPVAVGHGVHVHRAQAVVRQR